MDHIEQLTAFSDSLDALVDHYAREFNVPAVTIMGILNLKCIELSRQILTPDSEDDED